MANRNDCLILARQIPMAATLLESYVPGTVLVPHFVFALTEGEFYHNPLGK